MRNARGEREIADLVFEAPVRTVEEVFEIEKYLDRILMRSWQRVEIPEESKALWSFCLIQTTDLIEASQGHVRAWALLLAVPFLLFQRPGKTKSKGSVTRIVHNRLLRFVRWDIQSLLEEAEEQWTVNQEIMSTKSPNKPNVDLRSG